MGYGDPPTDRRSLEKLARRYGIEVETLYETASAYRSRPQFIIDIAKRRLASAAALIGEIVERKHKESQIRRLNRVYAMLSNINQAIVRIREPEKLFQTGCRIAMEDGGFGLAWLGMIRPETGHVHIEAFADRNGRSRQSLSDFIAGYELNEGGLADTVIRQGWHGVVNRIESGSRPQPWQQKVTEMGHQSAAAFPITVGGQTRGVFCLYADTADFFDTDEIHLLDELAMDLALAVELMEQEQKRAAAEHKLQQSRARYRDLFDNAPIGIFQSNASGGVNYINPHMAALVGSDVPEAAVAHYTDLGRQLYAEPARRQTFVERIRQHGEVHRFEFEAVRIDGVHRWFSMNARLSKKHGDRDFSIDGFTTDITEFKAMETALHESEKLFRGAFENASIGRALVFPDGRFHRVNPALCEMLGHDADTLLKKRFQDITHPEDIDPSRHAMEELLANKGRCRRLEKRYIRADGSALWVDVSFTLLRDAAGCPLHFIGDIYDISERKQVEENLRKNERILQETQRISKVGGWEYHVDSGRIFWTDEVYRIYEVSGQDHDPDDIQQDTAFYAPEDQKTIETAFFRAAHHGEPYDLELRLITSSGATTWIRTTGKPEIVDGRVVRVYGNIMDITEAKQAEQKRSELESQLHQAQKMEAVGRLAGGVAHDFNNLLSIIIGYSEMVLEDLESDHPGHGGVKQIHDAGVRARALTRQLLAFSRKQVLEIQTVDINQVIGGLEKLLHRVIGEDIELRIHPAAEPTYIDADIAQLEQVMMNLVINARDAMPDGGKLTIESAAVELDEVYAAERQEVVPGPHAMISVSDNGFGMDSQTRLKIFEPFYTTKDKDKGTGLGLATCFGIVKQHGGHIWVYSEPGQGTTFKIYLPHAPSRARRQPEKTEAESAPVTGSATVLVAEDEAPVR
ncbi:MAG: PAS domain S-box protein, partial [Thermodesulfobacteriota bacterium]